MSAPRPFGAAAGWLCLSIAAAAMSGRPIGAQAPPVHAGLAAFEFLALDEDGHHVTDLRRDELRLEIDGRPRELRSIELVRVAPGVVQARPGVPPPFATNRAPGRTVLIIFNHASMPPGGEREPVEAAARFVASLSAADRVGLMTMPNGRVHEEITTDRARIEAALRRVTGAAPIQGTESDRACTTRLTLETLTGWLTAQATAPAPTTIVFISSGLVTPRRDAPSSAPPGICEVRLEHFQNVARAATAARARLYVIQPDSAKDARTDAAAPTGNELTGLSSLAGAAGGQVLRLSSDPADRALERVARESAAYYLAFFEPAAADRDGAVRRLRLDVARPGVNLHASPQVVIPKAAAHRARSDAALQAMLRDSSVYDELPLRATAYASANPPDSKVMITVIAEAVDTNEPIAAAAIGLIDARGRLVDDWTAAPGQLASTPLFSTGAAEPDDYRVRVAAIDAAGRRGAVDFPFAARLGEAGNLGMSGLVLGVAHDGDFSPRLQFEREPSAMAYAELYGVPPPGAAVTARLEVLQDPDGPPVMTIPAHVATADPQRRIVSGAVAAGSLPPADYIIRAIVSLDDRPLLMAARTLRKVRP